MIAYALAAPMRKNRILQLAVLSLSLLLGGLSLVTGQSSPPPVNLSSEPLYMKGVKTKTNLTLALSVERPTVGQTYDGNVDQQRNPLPANDYDPAKKYIGYFDDKRCYRHTSGHFEDHDNRQAGGGCQQGNSFDGNFMNWATSSAIDIMRLGLTGGNRLPQGSNDDGAVLERAYLPDDFYRSDNFRARYISQAAAKDLVPSTFYNQIPAGGLWIYNCKNRVYFADQRDDTGDYWDPGDCNAPLSTKFDQHNKHPNLIPKQQGFYEVRVKVCHDAKSVASRPMQFDSNLQRWEGLCFKYPNGKYKPVGQLQMNSDAVRVAVFSYLQDNDPGRYGGVLRAPLKYLGPNRFDPNFDPVSGTNPEAEWDAQTGVFEVNPHRNSAAPYEDQGFKHSGVINYLNKFGTLDPNALGVYKKSDPVGELYYEALRYLQGKQPTPEALACPGCSAAKVADTKGHFPAYGTWVDPSTGFVDAPGTAKSCLRNNIVAIADTFTHFDRQLPGNTQATGTPTFDFARAAETHPSLDVMDWTRVVGSFETKTAGKGLSYLDSKNRPQNAGNLASANLSYPITQALEWADIMGTGAGGTNGSYLIAGLAYWANTQTFRTDYPQARVKTFVIDVDERGASSSQVAGFSGPAPQWRQTRQLHLAAKYGGFDDASAQNTGNPYHGGTNALWQGANGDAKNYFLASDPQKFLDSIAEVFVRAREEAATIAGGAISSQRLTSSTSADVYFAKFNPESNWWSGRVFKYNVKSAGNSMAIAATHTWEAGDVLTKATQKDQGASRNIIVGPALGQQGTATSFIWTSLSTDHKKSLNTLPNLTTDKLGQDRLAYLRGDQKKETNATPPGPFRARDIVLGDIINSGLVYMGKPDFATLGYMHNTNTVNYAARRAFVNQNATRKNVIFANANDGMLHAFDDANGKELFAYIPGFLVPKLSALTDPKYVHRSLADATPAVQDAYFKKAWRTALVSGVGGGFQGVYALDVSDPSKVSAKSALWEFTDQDHPAMGNVIGAPQILKFRMEDAKNATHTYKYMAVVASGVNNYAPDAHRYSTGQPSLFFLDLNYDPINGPWKEGVNFWRVELPQATSAMAMGLAGFSSTTDFARNTVNALYAGDLQGNLWKLNFSDRGFNDLTNVASDNFDKFNFASTRKTIDRQALFIATDSNGSLQPITGTPEIVYAYNGDKLVAFGTGKLLELPDLSRPLVPSASFYAVLDDRQNPVKGRAVLQPGTVANGTVTVPDFSLGTPATGSPNKAGWYLDLNASAGERQVSTITPFGGKLIFSSMFPSGSCGGGGNTYMVDALTGNGTSDGSTVGVLGAPMVVELGAAATLTKSGTAGRRTATKTFGLINQGSEGLAVSSLSQTVSYEVGRMSWRQINNYQQLAK